MAPRRMYDEAGKYHSDDETWSDCFDEDAASTHMAMFLAWAALRGMASGRHEGAAELLRERRTTPGEYFALGNAETLSSADFDEEGDAFARDRYLDHLGAYGDVFGSQPDQFFAVPDSWESYDRIAPRLDAMLADWRAAPRQRVRRLFSRRG